jgi:hypothetical protein
MPDMIPQGIPFEEIAASNTSQVRGQDLSVIDNQAAWLVMARLLQQPVSVSIPPITGVSSAGNLRYRVVRCPPGTTHLKCAALYLGGAAGIKGPRFSARMVAAGAFGTASRLPHHLSAQVFPGVLSEATWSETDWMATQDVPVADQAANVAIKGIAGRVDTQWQDAWVMMEIDLTWGVPVHAWTVDPVVPPSADSP